MPSGQLKNSVTLESEHAVLLPIQTRLGQGNSSVKGHRDLALAQSSSRRWPASVEISKAVDLVIMDTRDVSWVPRGDLATHLIWGAPSHTVRDVLVDGAVVVRDRQVTTIDINELRREAGERSAALLRRAGIHPPRRWPAVLAADHQDSTPTPAVVTARSAERRAGWPT
jgi:hypothetical protein